jgi:trk system potassium uptake protein TrkA
MDPKRAEFAAKNLQHTEVLCGDGLDVDVLREANAQLSEMVIAVTDDDKVNILSSLLAKRQGTEHAISLLNHSSYVSFVKAHGVDAVINPKAITISSILQHIRQGRIRAIHSLYDDFAELLDVEARETSAAVGLSLGEIATRGETLVAALIRDDAIIFAPNKNTFLRIDDRLILVVSKTSIKKIEKMFSIRTGYL